MRYVFEDTSESIYELSKALEEKYHKETVMSVDYSVKHPIAKCYTDKGTVVLNIGDSIDVDKD